MNIMFLQNVLQNNVEYTLKNIINYLYPFEIFILANGDFFLTTTILCILFGNVNSLLASRFKFVVFLRVHLFR